MVSLISPRKRLIEILQPHTDTGYHNTFLTYKMLVILDQSDLGPVQISIYVLLLISTIYDNK